MMSSSNHPSAETASGPNPLTVFETLGDLYYRRYHCLRPGKDEGAGSYRDSNDDENRAQFSTWVVSLALLDALARIVQLEKQIEDMESSND
jgi:hypothetical protein